MTLSIEFEGQAFTADGSECHDLSLPFQENGGASAWYVDPMKVSVVRANGFLGSVKEGGAVNFRDVTFNPHGNGTHTECVGHITPEAHSVNDHPIPPLMPCLVISIEPESWNDDRRITSNQIQACCAQHWSESLPLPPALIIRTMPNAENKRSKNWSNTNPPYFQADALGMLAARGVDHLLVDLPSVDREVDGGALAAHHAFWSYPEAPRLGCTISEFLYVPKLVPDGRCLLNLQVAPFALDAAPSRPLIFPCPTL